jgi:hypothetical protein
MSVDGLGVTPDRVIGEHRDDLVVRLPAIDHPQNTDHVGVQDHCWLYKRFLSDGRA